MKKIYEMVHNFKIDKKFWTYDGLTGEDYDFKRSKPAYYIKKAIEIAKYLEMKTDLLLKLKSVFDFQCLILSE